MQQKAEGSLLNAAYFIGMVVVITVVLVLLYKYRCMKIIYGYLMFSTFSLLFFTGGVLLGNLILHFSVTVDWLTFVFLMANFGALGSFAVFFTAPSIVKQGYLVCVSVIMAWSLSKLPDWTNWTILIALAVYDLFAVLSPCGPLKALVEMSQSRNEPIPGLVYEADAPEDTPPATAHPQTQTARSQDAGDEETGHVSAARDLKVDVQPRLRGRGGGGNGDGVQWVIANVLGPARHRGGACWERRARLGALACLAQSWAPRRATPCNPAWTGSPARWADK